MYVIIFCITEKEALVWCIKPIEIKLSRSNPKVEVENFKPTNILHSNSPIESSGRIDHESSRATAFKVIFTLNGQMLLSNLIR